MIVNNKNSKVNYSEQKGAIIMQGYFAIITIILLVIMILCRVFLLRKMGIKVIKFGEIDKRFHYYPICFGVFLSCVCKCPELAGSRNRIV